MQARTLALLARQNLLLETEIPSCGLLGVAIAEGFIPLHDIWHYTFCVAFVGENDRCSIVFGPLFPLPEVLGRVIHIHGKRMDVSDISLFARKRFPRDRNAIYMLVDKGWRELLFASRAALALSNTLDEEGE
jgi:hypothetical protein